jgi:hypothetical protein
VAEERAARRAQTATRVVVFITAAFALLSVRQIWVRARPSIPYASLPAMSKPWNEPPDDEAAEWRLSEGQAPPPAANATHAELLAWLRRHYPILGLELPKPILDSDAPTLDLGGGPPRRLFVEPGLGVVGRQP